MTYAAEFHALFHDPEIRRGRFRVRFNGTSGTITVQPNTVTKGLQVCYPRYTKLGKLLKANAEGERYFIGLKLSGYGYDRDKIEFVSVN